MTVERISRYKRVNTRNIMIVNKTQPVLLSQPHLKGKHTICVQIALRSFGAIRKLETTRKNQACTRQPFLLLRKCCESNNFHSSALTTDSNRLYQHLGKMTNHFFFFFFFFVG